MRPRVKRVAPRRSLARLRAGALAPVRPFALRFVRPFALHFVRPFALALAFALVLALPCARASAVEFGADEIARIARHGPWPAEPPRDPSNAVSGDARAIALGRRLFAEARLSASGTISCASCHDPARGFTDGRARARGLGEHDRNAQALFNLAWQRWFGWDGGADSLWSASIRPMLASREMGASTARLAALVRSDRALAREHAALFGPLDADDDRIAAGLAKAIAAFLETLVSPRTRFDDFRDALVAGDGNGVAAYPEAAKRGLKIFLGRGNCGLCHVGPRFTNGEFHDVGIPFIVAPGRVDPGRHAGIERVRSDRFNLLSRLNDEPAGAPLPASLRTRTVVLQHRNWGEWKTPGLRHLRSSAPYMHDGSKPDLRAVVRHYSELDPDRLHADGEAILRPLRLSEAEIDDLVAFLETLSP